MARAPRPLSACAFVAVRGARRHCGRHRDRRSCRPQLLRRAQRARHQRVRGGTQARRSAANRRQARGHRAVERRLARAHGPRARRARPVQSCAGRVLAAGAGAAAPAGGARGARPRCWLRDRRCRADHRGGHSRRAAGAPAPAKQARGKFHRRGDEPCRRRHRRPRRSRHRPLRRPARDRGRGRAARLPGNPLPRRRQAVPAGREHRAPLALRLGGSGRRARPARLDRLAVAQGADEEPHPRDRGRADQGRRRAAIARGAAACRRHRPLRRILRRLPL